MYFCVIGILSIILACPAPLMPWRLRDPGMIIAAIAVAALVPPLLVLLGARVSLRRLESDPAHPALARAVLARAHFWGQSLLGVGYAVVLLFTDALLRMPFQTLVRDRGGRLIDIRYDVPGAAGLSAALPMLLSIVLMWVVSYPAEKAIRQNDLEQRFLRDRPVRPVWTLLQSLLFQFRHQVGFVLVPMLLLQIVRDLVLNHEARIVAAAGNPEAPNLLIGAAAMLVAVIAPIILRYVWKTQPLPEGPLRDRLLALCRRMNMRCREILVWHSGGMIVNAAVMGVIPRLRYVLITDAMIEQMDESRIEAVFGHESGHVKRRHILYFLLFAFITGCGITIVGQHLQQFRPQSAAFAAIVFCTGAVLLAKWGVIFGWISRSFERQADLYGVRALALAGSRCDLPCPLHASTGPPAPEAIESGPRLCRSAAAAFSETLLDVARLNGIPPSEHSWRHGSIALRSEAVERFALDPAATERFECGVDRIKRLIWLTAVVSALWAAWEIRIWTIIPGLAKLAS